MEKIENKIEEKELKPATIELHFFRHSLKEENKKGDPLKDEDVRISKEGRKLAIEKSFEGVNLSQSIAFGSPRIRTQETAIYMMSGKKEDITGDETLEELKKKINKDLKFGSKIGVDSRLNFTDDIESPLGKIAFEAYKNGNYIKFLVEESDKIAQETGDNTKSNYSARASQVAKIINKYLKILPRWQELVSDKKNNYEEKLERFLGTHDSVPVTFLVKVLELIGDEKEKESFIEENSKGANYLEGLTVKLKKGSEDSAKILIQYKLGGVSKQVEISKSQLEHIVNDTENHSG